MIRLAIALMLVLAGALPVRAELADILAAGRVRIGVPVDVPPFGYLDDSQKPVGLDVEVAKLIAQGLGVELDLQQITGANRIPFLLTNKLDLVVSALGATPERARQIAFSQPYSALAIGVFGPADTAVSLPGELGALRVAVARGSTQDIELTRLAPGARIARYDDDSTAVTAFLSGQADLLGSASVVAAQIAKQNPGRAPVPKFTIRLSPNHVGMRQGNPILLRWVDTFVFYNRVNGTLDRLSQQFLGAPLPANLPPL